MVDRWAVSAQRLTDESERAPTPLPTETVRLAAPPELPGGRGAALLLLPVLALAVTVGAGALAWSSGSPVMRSPAMLAFPAMTLVSALGMLIHNRGFGGAELDEQRRRYLERLESLDDEMREAAVRQRESMEWSHPQPALLWNLVGGPRMWRRAAGDPDFGHVRLGRAAVPLCRSIEVAASPPADRLDPVSVVALRRFVRAHSACEDVPVVLALPGVARLSVTGAADGARSLLRAVLCQLSFAHSPSELLVVAVVEPESRAHWDWLKWLPHNDSPIQGGPMVYDGAAQAEAALGPLLSERGAFGSAATPPAPYLVVVIDGHDGECGRLLGGRGVDGTTVLAFGHRRPPGVGMPALRIDGDRLAVHTARGATALDRVDGLSLADARVCARRLARYRTGDHPESGALARWHADLGLGSVNQFDPQHFWSRGSAANRLRVPMGTTASGGLVELDIKEAAEHGAGPHGLCLGATGSGKSELLRTVVLGMVARHSPEELNLVLIDFKGGAAFLGLDGLHHVAAVITNLADEAHLVARMKDALGGEIHRRQQVLRKAGNVTGFAAYRRLRCRDNTLEPLPSLFVVVDEFAELLHQQPDFVELFTTVARVGRSLGVHLLLASQRLDEGRLRGLDAHLSYRICLKTLTAAESRTVLGVPDAAELPNSPGAAIMRTSDGRLTRFQTVFVGAPDNAAPQRHCPPTVRPFTSVPSPPRSGDEQHCTRTVLDSVVARLGGHGPRARCIWLPPLPRAPGLDEIEQPVAGGLTAAIGLVDLPFEQRRTPLVVDLTGAGGNVAVVGAPQTGKSTAVRTLVAALARRYGARGIQFYCIDFGGGSLTELQALPHVGSVAYRHERELVRRTIAHVESILCDREASATRADARADVVLVIDGWAAFRDECGDLEPGVAALASRGLSLGVHVLLTAGRWADIRPALKDQIGTRIELRLGDPVDSEMDRRQAALVPSNRPGSGITEAGAHFVIATTQVGAVAVDGWRAPPVRLLPDHVDQDTVIGAAGGQRAAVLIGLGESALQPVAVDFARRGHLVILGDGECGKTAALRTLCREVVRTAVSEPAQLFVVDFRRALLGVVPAERLAGYAFSAPALREQLPGLIAELGSRLSAVGIAVERAPHAANPPDIFVVVDDYELVATALPDPFAGLLAMLPYAGEIGLHVILARRHAGSSRAMFEPFLTQLRDGGCMGLLMSGSPEEGVVLGNCRAATQPAGRGVLVTRGCSERIQVGWCPP